MSKYITMLITFSDMMSNKKKITEAIFIAMKRWNSLISTLL